MTTTRKPRHVLQARVTRASEPARLVRRGRVILLSAAGESGVTIAGTTHRLVQFDSRDASHTPVLTVT